MTAWTPRLALALVFCSPLAGCKDKSDVVSGSVSYNGRPVASGSISFQPDGTGAGFGAMIVDGKYTTDKVYPGKKIVLIHGVDAEAAPLTRESYEKAAEEARAAGRQESPLGPNEYIPADAEGNNQPVEITGGQQTLNFDLKGPPRG
jgi:hypothetical protein